MKTSRYTMQREGFTLTEVLVATALSAVIAGAIFTIYIAQQRNFIVGNWYINIHKDARMAMDWMAKDIRWTIELSPSHGAYSTSNNCIVLKVPSINSSGDVIDVENDHDFIIYKLTAGDPPILERIVDAKDGVSSRPDETRTVAKNVDSLVFSYNGTTLSDIGDLSTVISLDIALATSKTVITIDLSDNLSTTVKFRNKE